MKILFISDNYPPYIKAGSEVSTSLLAKWLSQQGHNVSVACSTFADKPWIENAAIVYPIIPRAFLKSENFLSAIGHVFKLIIQQFIATIRVLKLIRRLKPEIVNIIPSSYRFIPIIIGVRIFSNCPVVIDCRGYDLICPASLSPSYLDKKKDFDEETQTYHGYRCIGYSSKNDFSFLSVRPFALYESSIFNLYKASVRFVINHFGGIKLVGVSKYVQRQLILNGFKAEKTTSIYNISEHLQKLPNLQSKIPTFGFGGRIETDKGVWDLIAATELLQRELKSPFIVKIAGMGGEFINLQKYIKENNLTQVILLGHVRPDEILALYGESIAVVAPSRWPEPFGRFILESMSVGKPIIATRSGGITENIEGGVTGLLVDIGNVEQLAAAMRYFIENPEKVILMKDAIREKQKQYSADFIGEKRLELYKDLISGELK